MQEEAKALSRKYTAYGEEGILLDLLSTGLDIPFVKPSCKLDYGDYIEINDDLEAILSYFPNSIYYDKGELRCREQVTPLAMACYNYMVPIATIERLLQHAPDQTRDIMVINKITPILEDLLVFAQKPDIERIQEIVDLFERIPRQTLADTTRCSYNKTK